MNSALNIIQGTNSTQEFSCGQDACPRHGKVIYSLASLIQTAMANVLFRLGSKNTFHQENKNSEETEAAVARFAGIDSGNLPATRTIDDLLKKLDHEELNEVLMSVFEVLRKDKFFSDHPLLTPGGMYHLAIDAETVHKYTPSSAHDCAECPFCLKRRRGEEIRYLHMHVAVSLVCPGGIRIPMSCYEDFKGKSHGIHDRPKGGLNENRRARL